MGNIIGSKIESQSLNTNLQFIRKSKEEAKKYEWLYQCTNIEALKNILKSREIWLSNLQCVNDKEEVKRITVPEFEKSYYVACFTYENNIPKEHWDEYGDGENSILYGFKPAWVEKEAQLMYGPGDKAVDKDFLVYSSYDEVIDVTWNERKINNRICNPYYFIDFGFYKVVYDDKLKEAMDGNCDWNTGDNIMAAGRFITVGMPGIIKNTRGLCSRYNKEIYEKDWTSEKEVRLKVGIQSNGNSLPKDVIFPKMAVKLNAQAFEKLVIRFSPLMSEEKRRKSLEELKILIPNSHIEILD